MTDNSLLQPRGQEQSDLILSVSPSIGVNKDGARLKVRGTYSPYLLTYVGGTAGGAVRNSLLANARLEAVENFFFIDARAAIFQSFRNPFGPQPADLGTSTSNRVETRTLGLSPYIRGRLSGGSQYSARDDIGFTSFDASNQPDILSHSVAAQ